MLSFRFSFPAFLVFLIASTINGFSQPNLAAGKLDSLREIFPSEKIFIHTDRALYAPGDQLLYKVYVLDGNSLRPSGTSAAVKIELLDNRRNVVQTATHPLDNGSGSGVFELSYGEGGYYTLRAYTDW